MIRRLPAAAAALALLAAVAVASAQDGAPPADGLAEAMRRQDALLQDGGGEKALSEARERAAKEPKSAEALYLLGRILGNLGKIDEAKAQFDGAIEQDGHYAPAWRGLAVVHASRKELETAEREARKAFELDGSTESCYLLVNCLLAKGDRAGARKLLQDELVKNPGDDRLRTVYGIQLMQEGFYREAERELRQVLVKHPADATVRGAVVSVLFKTGRKDEAVKECVEAVKRAPRDQEALGLLVEFAQVLATSRDFERGEALMEGALAADLTAELKEKVTQHLKEFHAAAADARARAVGGGTGADEDIDEKEILRRLEEGTVEERRSAMKVLWEHNLNFIPKAVLRRAGDEDETVRLYAVRLVGRYGDGSHVGLIEFLLFHTGKKEPSVAVRAQTVLALGRIAARTGSPAALPVAIRAVEESAEPEVLRAALQAVREITGRSFTDDPDALVPDKDVAGLRARVAAWWFDDPAARLWRRKAAGAIGEAGDRGLAWYVVPWVKEEDAGMRTAMLDCMARITRDEGWRAFATGTAEERAAAADRGYRDLGELEKAEREKAVKPEAPERK